MDKDNVDTREVQVFVRITTKYIMKNTEKLLSLRKVYCESSLRNGLKILQN